MSQDSPSGGQRDPVDSTGAELGEDEKSFEDVPDIAPSKAPGVPKLSRGRSRIRAVKRGTTKPFESHQDPHWSKLRIWAYERVYNQKFDMAVGLVISLNVALIIHETNEGAKCFPQYQDNFQDCPTAGRNLRWVWATNLGFLVIYSLEASIRFFIDRAAYFCNHWNVLDFVIVVSGIFGEIFAGMIQLSVLRVFRVMRLVRAIRLLASFRELYLLIFGFASTLKTMLWASVMIVTFMTICAILFVNLVHPVTAKMDSVWNEVGCDRCGRAFNGVAAADLTLWQTIVAGDSWGLIALPVIDTKPWLAPIFFFTVMTISVGITNLVLAVIVERAAEARNWDTGQRVRDKEEERSEWHARLMSLAKQLDNDGDGLITSEDLLTGYLSCPEFRSLVESMDVAKYELNVLFRILDKEGNGMVTYDCFVRRLQQMKTRDVQTLITFVNNEASAFKKQFLEEIKRAEARLESRPAPQAAAAEAETPSLRLSSSVVNPPSEADLPMPSKLSPRAESRSLEEEARFAGQTLEELLSRKRGVAAQKRLQADALRDHLRKLSDCTRRCQAQVQALGEARDSADAAAADARRAVLLPAQEIQSRLRGIEDREARQCAEVSRHHEINFIAESGEILESIAQLLLRHPRMEEVDPTLGLNIGRLIAGRHAPGSPAAETL